MNGDAVKLQPPVATTVYTNVPVDTAMLATNLYGPTTQLAAPAATHIPLIATAGPQPPHPQALQVATAPAQHQQLITHTHSHTAAAPHTQQPTLQSIQSAAVAAAASQNTHQVQGHPQQAHLQFAHQTQIATGAGAGGATVTTTTIDNTEYAVMNGAITQDGTVVCYSQEELPVGMGGMSGTVANLVAVEQMSGTAGTTAHNPHAQHHVIMTNGPPPSAAQQQSQQQHASGGNNNNTTNNNNHNSSNSSSNNNSSTNTVNHMGDNNNGLTLDQLKQMLATQLEYYFSRFGLIFFSPFFSFIFNLNMLLFRP